MIHCYISLSAALAPGMLSCMREALLTQHRQRQNSPAEGCCSRKEGGSTPDTTGTACCKPACSCSSQPCRGRKMRLPARQLCYPIPSPTARLSVPSPRHPSPPEAQQGAVPPAAAAPERPPPLPRMDTDTDATSIPAAVLGCVSRTMHPQGQAHHAQLPSSSAPEVWLRRPKVLTGVELLRGCCCTHAAAADKVC